MLHVSYKKVFGYFYFEQDNGIYKCAIHPANCLFAICYHYKENSTKMTQLVGFFTDVKHFRRCFKPNDLVYENIKKVELYQNCPNCGSVAEILLKAGIKVILRFKK